MKSHTKNILIYYIGYLTIKDSKYLKPYSINPLYLILNFNKVNVYFEQINGNKYLMLVPINESKGKVKIYQELWNKIRDFTRSMTKITDDYDEKYMKTKLNSDEKLHLNKTIEILSKTIVVGAIFTKRTNIMHSFS